MNRLDQLPEPPSLPLLPDCDPTASGMTGRFSHIAGSIDRDTWGHLRRMCARHRMTPTAALCSVFAQALAAWAPTSRDTKGRMLINVMHTMRLPVHSHIASVFGNFSSTSLLAAPVAGSENGELAKLISFKELATDLADQLAADLEHWRFGGVDVSRELNARRGRTLQAVTIRFHEYTRSPNKCTEARGICATQGFTCVTTHTSTSIIK